MNISFKNKEKGLVFPQKEAACKFLPDYYIKRE